MELERYNKVKPLSHWHNRFHDHCHTDTIVVMTIVTLTQPQPLSWPLSHWHNHNRCHDHCHTDTTVFMTTVTLTQPFSWPLSHWHNRCHDNCPLTQPLSWPLSHWHNRCLDDCHTFTTDKRLVMAVFGHINSLYTLQLSFQLECLNVLTIGHLRYDLLQVLIRDEFSRDGFLRYTVYCYI